MQEPPVPGVHSQSTTADASSSNGAPPGFGLVEVRSAGAMGNGLFAVKDILCGTRIVEEAPIMAMPAPPEMANHLWRFCAELQRMTMEQKKRMDELYYETTLIKHPVAQALARKWYRDNKITDTNGAPLKGKRLQDVSKAALKRYAIFSTNVLKMGVDGIHGLGVFGLFSRINHSCVPNTYNSYNPSIKRLTIHAVRDIRAGEQITVSYILGDFLTKDERAEKLRNWGFSCACAACTDPELEALRQRSSGLYQRLAIYTDPEAARFLGIDTSRLGAVKAFGDANELLMLLLKGGQHGMELAIAYRKCARISLEMGDVRAARDYAVRELEIERRCMGTETEHRRAEMEGSKFWLEHLEEKLRASEAA